MAFAGDGKLSDSGPSAPEFRAFLAQIPSALLVRYVDECLTDSFNGSGLVLQDVINEIGRRLGFDVVPGRYRGVAGQIGLDGLWRSQEGHAFVIEVKTTDTYRVDLDTIIGYRTALVQSDGISEDRSSVLIVVGRQDTGDLEAQIRGSRHAWDVRLISSEALLKLLAVKEDVDDPHVRRRIHAILIPREFTRLDEIVDVLRAVPRLTPTTPRGSTGSRRQVLRNPCCAQFSEIVQSTSFGCEFHARASARWCLQ